MFVPFSFYCLPYSAHTLLTLSAAGGNKATAPAASSSSLSSPLYQSTAPRTDGNCYQFTNVEPLVLNWNDNGMRSDAPYACTPDTLFLTTAVPIYDGRKSAVFDNTYSSLPLYHGEVTHGSCAAIVFSAGSYNTNEKIKSLPRIKTADKTVSLNILSAVVFSGPDKNAFPVGANYGVDFDASVHRFGLADNSSTPINNGNDDDEF